MSDAPLRSVPVISTRHLSDRTGGIVWGRRGFPWLEVAPYETGFLVKVPQTVDTFEENPADLEAVFEWARQRGHEWVWFDEDGYMVECLPDMEA